MTLALSGSGFPAGFRRRLDGSGTVTADHNRREPGRRSGEQAAIVKLTPGESDRGRPISLVSPHGTRAARSVTIK